MELQEAHRHALGVRVVLAEQRRGAAECVGTVSPDRSMIVATIAMVVAVPLGVAMALFINEYAPARLRAPLTRG